MFAVCAVIVFLFRSCFQGSYIVNGRILESMIIVKGVARLLFQLVTAGTMFLTALISMRVMRRDSEYGTQSYVLSKPISRWQYILGKVSGLWLLSILLMFILQGILLVTANIHLRLFVGDFFIASVLCIFNLLFVIVAILFLTLIMPEALAFLAVIGIGIISFVGEGIYSLSHSQFVQMAEQTSGRTAGSVWEMFYYFWPKLAGVQHSASMLVGSDSFRQIGSIYPFVNVILYIAIFGALLFWRFRAKQIT